MHNNRQQARGFTLVEILIVVTVVAILAFIALPSYQQHVIKTKRSLAKAELMEVLSRQEQFFVNNRQYALWIQKWRLEYIHAGQASCGDTLVLLCTFCFCLCPGEPDARRRHTRRVWIRNASVTFDYA